jgi:L-rhamnose-H+ transport protein
MGWVGYLKDRKKFDTEKKVGLGEFNFLKGAIAAVLVGITGSAMSLGFEQGIPMAEIGQQYGINPLFITMPVMLVLLSGTFITTIVWCIYLGIKNKSFRNYIKAASSNSLFINYLFALLAGLLWFSQFILYGMGKSKMGPFTFTSWGILMGLTIVFATLWGLYRKEWKGAPLKICALIVISLLIIICSSYIIGISGSI